MFYTGCRKLVAVDQRDNLSAPIKRVIRHCRRQKGHRGACCHVTCRAKWTVWGLNTSMSKPKPFQKY